MLKKNKKYLIGSILILVAVFIGLVLVSHKHSKTNKKQNIYIVKKIPNIRQFAFNGNIKPIINIPVVSKTTAIINKVYFVYGQVVKKGDKLFTISTSSLSPDLRTAQINFMQEKKNLDKLKNWDKSLEVGTARESVELSKRKLEHAKKEIIINKKLFALGVISKDTLTQSQNALLDAKNNYENTKIKLQITVAKGDKYQITLEYLKYETLKEKYNLIKEQYNIKTIFAPASGIVLKPINNLVVNGTVSKTTLVVGSSIKKDELLLNIGDITGISIAFKIPETNINEINKGMKVNITSSSLGNIKLSGVISGVSAQTNSAGSFDAQAVIKKLTKHEQNLLHVGINVSVGIDIHKGKDLISVPVSAIHVNNNDQSYVYMYKVKTGEYKQQLVSLGKVIGNNVEIKSGVKVADKVKA